MVKKYKSTSCRNECPITVETENGEIKAITGNGCRRGIVSVRRMMESEKEKTDD